MLTDADGKSLTVEDPFDSGSVYYDNPKKFDGYNVRHAFENDRGCWGGRKDEKADLFYLGGYLENTVATNRRIDIRIEQPGEDHVVKVGHLEGVSLLVENPWNQNWRSSEPFSLVAGGFLVSSVGDVIRGQLDGTTVIIPQRD